MTARDLQHISVCVSLKYTTCILSVSIEEMRHHGIQHHAPPDDADSFISLLLILLCGLVYTLCED